jgi:hypothetical protein
MALITREESNVSECVCSLRNVGLMTGGKKAWMLETRGVATMLYLSGCFGISKRERRGLCAVLMLLCSATGLPGGYMNTEYMGYLVIRMWSLVGLGA